MGVYRVIDPRISCVLGGGGGFFLLSSYLLAVLLHGSSAEVKELWRSDGCDNYPKGTGTRPEDGNGGLGREREIHKRVVVCCDFWER